MSVGNTLVLCCSYSLFTVHGTYNASSNDESIVLCISTYYNYYYYYYYTWYAVILIYLISKLDFERDFRQVVQFFIFFLFYVCVYSLCFINFVIVL
jgi:hypothetical protein